MGKFLVIIGVVIALIGLIFWGGFAPKWLGRLPGDIRIERGNSAFYFPIVTCIILSILLSLLLSIFRRCSFFEMISRSRTQARLGDHVTHLMQCRRCPRM